MMHLKLFSLFYFVAYLSLSFSHGDELDTYLQRNFRRESLVSMIMPHKPVLCSFLQQDEVLVQWYFRKYFVYVCMLTIELAFACTSLFPYWRSTWPYDYLIGEEALFSTPLFENCLSEPFYTTSTQSSFWQDELNASFEGDVLRFWDEMGDVETTNKDDGEKALQLVCYSGEKEETCKKMKGDSTREENTLTFELLSQYFYVPITQAARELNVGLTLLKKKCRELGIPRWPHRKMKSLQTLINNVQELGQDDRQVGEEKLSSVIEILQQERKLMEQKPHIQLEEKTKRLRQACFKANYKKRRLMALDVGEASR